MRRNIIVIAVLVASAWMGQALAPEHPNGPAAYAAILAQHPPTATPVPPTPTPAPELYEGVAICQGHDNTEWHPLVERDSSGAITCTYLHEHHDDPSTPAAVAAFGQPGSYWGSSDSISYPWATSGENDTLQKHVAYKYQVVTGMGCKPQPATATKGISDLRVQAHNDASPGAKTRFHSAFVEARLCDTTDPSWSVIVRTGGHFDYGCLRVKNGPGGADFEQVAVPQDSMPPTTLCSSGGPRREHGSSVLTTGNKFDSTWYARYGFVSVLAVIGDTWGPINPADPSQLLFFPSPQPPAPPLVYNNSYQLSGHLLEVFLSNSWDLRDGVNDNIINAVGYTNELGAYVASCSPIGPNCVPFQAVGGKEGVYQVRSGLPVRDYDVNSPVTGKSLIRFPN